MVVIFAGMLIFALVHSITADKRLKNRIRDYVGTRRYEGFYRITYNLVSIILIAPILLYMALAGEIIWEPPPSLWLIFDVLQLVGIIGLAISLLQVDFGRFAGISQAIAYFQGKPLPLPDENLQTGGVYQLVRHPLYLFSLLAIWPVYPLTDTMLAFNISATLYFIIGSRMEEKRLLNIFGQEYARYQAQVPWLLPFPRP